MMVEGEDELRCRRASVQMRLTTAKRVFPDFELRQHFDQSGISNTFLTGFNCIAGP
jgi:hypothetical protein